MVLFGILFGLLVSCINGQAYDPDNNLQIATTSQLTEIKDKTGNVILKRDEQDAKNKVNKWTAGTIDGVDLTKFNAFATNIYEHKADYEWNVYPNDYSFQQKRAASERTLLVDTQGVFGGFSATKSSMTNVNMNAESDICGNPNIFCFPNKYDPYALFEKLATTQGRPVLLTRTIGAGHDGMDAKVKPNAKWPWRAPGCSIDGSTSCEEYEIDGEVSSNKWFKYLYNLRGTHSDDPATKQSVILTWDDTTKQGTFINNGNPSKIAVFGNTKRLGWGIYRDKQGMAGECVMNAVNTVLGQRYWNNKQYATEFCTRYGPNEAKGVIKAGLCKKDKVLGFIPHFSKVYSTFGDQTVVMALNKVGAFKYQIDVNELYLVDPNDPHQLLGFMMGYDVMNVGIFGHETAFVYRAPDWYYINSHSDRSIRKYDSVLDVIQDIKRNFAKFRMIQIVRILQSGSAVLNPVNPSGLDANRGKKQDKTGNTEVMVQQIGGEQKKRQMYKYEYVNEAHQDYDDMADIHWWNQEAEEAEEDDDLYVRGDQGGGRKQRAMRKYEVSDAAHKEHGDMYVHHQEAEKEEDGTMPVNVDGYEIYNDAVYGNLQNELVILILLIFIFFSIFICFGLICVASFCYVNKKKK
eukprot:269874_1